MWMAERALGSDANIFPNSINFGDIDRLKLFSQINEQINTSKWAFRSKKLTNEEGSTTFPVVHKSASWIFMGSLYGFVQLPSATDGKKVFSTISFYRFLCSSLERCFLMSFLPPFAYLISLLHQLTKSIACLVNLHNISGQLVLAVLLLSRDTVANGHS